MKQVRIDFSKVTGKIKPMHAVNDGSNPCWQGTKEQFWDLFEIAAKHLKKTFPDLKIGGEQLVHETLQNINRMFR